MKKYFKIASETIFGKGHVYFEFDNEMVVRQVEHYGERWFSSREGYHEELGPSLCDVPLSQMELYEEDEITREEFEASWEQAGKHSCQ